MMASVKMPDYDFGILVTCLIILVLQIHNPFQSAPQCRRSCGGGSRKSKDDLYCLLNRLCLLQGLTILQQIQRPGGGAGANS